MLAICPDYGNHLSWLINPYIDPKAELCYAKQSHPPRTAFFGFEMYETWLIFGALKHFFSVY